MILRVWLLTVLSLGFFSFAYAQQQITLSGYVQDAASGEKLIGASVYDLRTQKGTRTNVYGFFSLTLPKDSVLLRVSYIGYVSAEYRLAPEADTRLEVMLRSDAELEELVITDRGERIEESSQMSSVALNMEMVNALPVLLGERDVMKAIQLLPGVQSGNEGSSGLYVRGGGPDQNLLLLDGVPVYNASHLFGFFSVFNSDALQSVELIKGGFPARYGGRLSSVVDIRMKEGNQKEFHGEGAIGLVASRFTFEGPLKKDKTSFIVSARRTYIDLLARPFIKMASEGQGTGGYYFYDVNAKINHKFSERSRLYFSNYFGDDKFYFRNRNRGSSGMGEIYNDYTTSGLRWGNIISALRWNYEINNRLFSNTTITYSRYRFNVGYAFESERSDASGTRTEKASFDYFSGIQDWAAKVDFDYIPNPRHYIRFGLGDIYHTFTPGVNQFKSQDSYSAPVDTSYGSFKTFAHEFYGYIEDDFNLSDNWKMNGGLHLSGFVLRSKTYFSAQPRFSTRYLVGKNSSLKASYARMAQYIHLLTNTSIGLPTDLWVPATGKVRPQFSDQVALGYAQTLKEKFQFSVETYYKHMRNVIEYVDGASFLDNAADWQDKVESGQGWAYGVEFLLEKKTGKTTGWIGYTLAWNNRRFENINFGKTFPYRYDRRHDIGVAIYHKFNERVDIGVVWVYGTGNAVTLGHERYMPAMESLGNWGFPTEVVHIDSRNNYRMPSYHRLDIGVNLHKKLRRHERTWSFGVYNLYSRQNPFFLYFGTNTRGNTVLKQVSLFPLIPSFSYAFKF